MSSEQKYPGYEELTTYLNEYKNKSFWSFLLLHRDTIVANAKATSCCEDLEGDWVRNFLLEARKLGEDLKGKVSSERTRAKNNFEDYWNGVISECKIKQDIFDYELEKERILCALSEINNKIQMKQDELAKNSSEWKIVSEDASSSKDLVNKDASSSKDLVNKDASSSKDLVNKDPRHDNFDDYDYGDPGHEDNSDNGSNNYNNSNKDSNDNNDNGDHEDDNQHDYNHSNDDYGNLDSSANVDNSPVDILGGSEKPKVRKVARTKGAIPSRTRENDLRDIERIRYNHEAPSRKRKNKSVSQTLSSRSPHISSPSWSPLPLSSLPQSPLPMSPLQLLPSLSPPRSYNIDSSDEEERPPRKKNCLNCPQHCPGQETT